MSTSALDFVPEAVLLDMDGLMVDSERAMLDCWRETSVQHGLDVDDALWLSMIGLHDADCRVLLDRSFGEAQAERLRRDCDARYHRRVSTGLPLMPGVVELLELLRRHAMPRAVVTSTRRERALHKLEACGLMRYFEVVVSGCDVALPKPAPEGYLKASEALGVDPRTCVVLEDSVPGVRAALAAGMTPIQVPDLVPPDARTRALGHRIADSLDSARALIASALAKA